MQYVVLVTVIALGQFLLLGGLVGRARGKYGVQAPATSGAEGFERVFRVHVNTLEQLIVFLPLLWMFAQFISPIWAAAFGAVFIVGRAVYAMQYIRDPKSRALGFMLSMLPCIAMLIGLSVWAVRAILMGA